jgi:hypothetical protein
MSVNRFEIYFGECRRNSAWREIFGGADGIRTHDLPGHNRDALNNRSIYRRSF